MTIRAGGGPRRDRSQAHPAHPAHPDDRTDAARRSGPPGGPPRRGSGGLFRFLVFALVLGGIVLATLVAVVRPVVAGLVIDVAGDNPGALRIPFVADIVRADIGPALTEPAGTDPAEVEFVVEAGDTPSTLAPRLEEQGLVKSQRAFLFQAFERELAARLEAGRFLLRRNMTPDQVVTGLVENRIVVESLELTFREGLRIEQMTAKLQTVASKVDPKEFHDLATKPPTTLLADYEWLELPDGASLEGYLYPSTYTLRLDAGGPTQAEDLVRMMLDEFAEQVGAERMVVPESRGMSFYEILTLASIVEREAQLDEERPLIAGVFQNRLNRLRGIAPVLAADPIVFYALDTLELESLDFDRWQEFAFWVPPGRALSAVELPERLAGYQSYRVAGLPPGPICSPSTASIDAALQPTTEDGYLFFLAIPEGEGSHAFAKTQAEHDDNRRKYGYL